MQTLAHWWTRSRAWVCVFAALLLAALAAPAGAAQAGTPGYFWSGGTSACTTPPFTVGSSPPAACGTGQCPGGVAIGANAGGDQVWFTCANASGTITVPMYVLRKPACQATAGGGVSSYSTNQARDLDCQVPASQCSGEAGIEQTTNYTVQWGKSMWAIGDAGGSNAVGDYVGPAIGSSSCVHGCQRTVGALQQVFTSLEPSPNGLYRLSGEFLTTGTGAVCTVGPADAAADPTTPDRPCPGAKGEVNGKPACIPRSGTGPSNPASAPPIASVPGDTGNPAAGDKPATGPGAGDGGQGRTPPSGSGGNAGGSSSAVGAGPTQTGTPGGGTAGDPFRPKDPCGLPGTPACKIDETGTPDGKSAYNATKTAFDTAATAHGTQITGAATQVKGVAWAWAFTLPGGACSPIAVTTRLGSIDIDPCSSSGIALMRNMIAYLFFGLAGLYIWRSATASAPGGK